MRIAILKFIRHCESHLCFPTFFVTEFLLLVIIRYQGALYHRNVGFYFSFSLGLLRRLALWVIVIRYLPIIFTAFLCYE